MSAQHKKHFSSSFRTTYNIIRHVDLQSSGAIIASASAKGLWRRSNSSVRGDSTYHFVHSEVTSNTTQHIRRHTIHLILRLEKVDHIAYGSARRFADVRVDTCRAVVFLVVMIRAHGVEMWRLRIRSIFTHGEPNGYLHGRFDSRS